MRITIWSPKGGQGKTSLALAIAMEFKFLVVTNDTHSPIDSTLPEGTAMRLAPGEAFPDVPKSEKLIYDLGGNSEARVISAAKDSDIVLMPVIYGSPYEMQVFLEGVKEMLAINPNIILIVNSCPRGKFGDTCEIINQFYDLPIIEIKQSRAFARMIIEGKSIGEMCSTSKLSNFHFGSVRKQLHGLMRDIFELSSTAKVA